MTIDATNHCDLLAAALTFRDAGFAVHWLKERSKQPAGGDGWQDAPVADVDRLRATYRDGMNLGLRTGEPSKVAGLYAHVFDIDIRFDDLADEAWAAFDRMLPGIRDKLPCVVSGSGGESRHLHFLTDKPFYGRKLAVSDAKHRTANGGPTYNWEIDLFGTGRQVAMPPSIHPGTGIAYRWEREYDLDGLEFGGGPIIDSAVIEALGIASTSAFGFEAKPPLEFKPGQMEKELDSLSLDILDDRAKWLMLGQALHHQFGGSTDGFELWMRYSAKSESHLKHSSLRAELSRYRGFGRNRREPVTMATVRGWYLREREAMRVTEMMEGLPDLDADQEVDEFDALLVACSPSDDAVFSTGINEDGGTAVVRRLNRRHAVVSHNGRALIVTEDESAIHFGTSNDLHTFYENDRRPKPGTKDNDRPDQTEPVSRYWMRHRDRRTYPNGVTFAPGRDVPGAINLWRGWAVEPKAAASCEHILNHVREVICRGDEGHAAYLFGWMAHLVQRPADKPGVAILLKGGKGAGKDTLGDYLAAMMGRYHAPTVSQDKHITGNFNRRLESALLLHVQEGTWAGDLRAEGVLKYLVTSEWIEIERKGIDTFQLPSFLRLFISSNADWAVPASADERRWAVFNVSDARQGDAAYFRAIRDEMAGDGPAALLAWLQAYDLTGFNVRAAPETEGLLEQKLVSLRGIERWWYDVLSAGELRTHNLSGDDWAAGACKTPRTELREEYARWLRDQKFEGNPLGDRQFGAKLREMVRALHDKRGGSGALRIREYVLPPLDVCREQFSEWVGGPVDWDG